MYNNIHNKHERDTYDGQQDDDYHIHLNKQTTVYIKVYNTYD